MKTRFTAEAIALAGLAAGLIAASGCRTTYSDSNDLSLTAPLPDSLSPESVGSVTLPTPEAEKVQPYWKSHPEAVAALDKPAAVKHGPVPTAGGYTTYVVKPGESLSKIAVAHGFRTADVLAVNPGINANKIRAGQTIVLPGATTKTATAAKAAAPAPAPAAGGVHIVQKGEILGRIANKYGVKVAELKKANGLTSDKIIVGQKLVIPGAKTVAAPKTAAPKAPAAPVKVPAPAPVKVSAPQVKAPAATPPAPVVQPPAPVVPPPAPVAEPPAVEPGAVPPSAPPAVEPPAPAPAPAAQKPAAKGMPYVVEEGQDLFDIAIKWGVTPNDIKALNNMSSDTVTPGQTLLIPVPRAE